MSGRTFFSPARSENAEGNRTPPHGVCPHFETPRRSHKRPPQMFTLELSLKKLYTGCTIPLYAEVEQTCAKCRGSGQVRSQRICSTCEGSGRVYILSDPFQIGFKSPDRRCPDCNGRGHYSSGRFRRCRKCEGVGTEKIMEELEVEVNPGTKDGDVISFERLDDVLVTIIQKPHPTFERSGSTLIVHKTITLGEALVGAKFPLKHLDGRTLLCSTEPNTVISPGTILTVPNEGFPKSGSPGHFGDLVIIFDVAFPNAHEIDLIALRAFCPLPLEEIPPAGDDVCYCEMMDASAVDFSHADDTMQSSGLDSD